MNQKHRHEEDAALMGVTHVSDSRNIYLPASYFGSCHWATEQISVAENMALQHSSSL